MEYGYGDESSLKVRGTIIEVHIADCHIGAFEPLKQYQFLKEQFLDQIVQLPKIDIVSVDGDLFDHKVMSNSDAAMIATRFVAELVEVVRQKNATLVLLSGTTSHDFDQLKLFYHYMNRQDVDVRVCTTLRFEEIHGARILMVPELNGLDEDIYQKYFHQSGWYDEAFVHGTFEGSVYGNMVSGSSRLLTARDFNMCKGFAVSGHVHTGGVFQGFYYYCGSPYRWRFGEEQEKGYLVIVHDLDTQMHYTSFQPIHSFRYDTIEYNDIVEDPKKVIDWIIAKRANDGIDYIKVRFNQNIPGYNKTIINNYFRNNPFTTIEFTAKDQAEQQKQELVELNQEYSYLTDPTLSDYDKFCRYVNDKEGEQIISVDALLQLLSDKV